jgi:hypothetical protein
VQLTYANGVVMKDGLQSWRPVPEEIVLPSDEPMSLHVREAGDTRMVSTRVLARRVKTTVVVGPKLVRWPGDSVHVEVIIEGEEGGPQPDWVEPRFRVLLGIDHLDVSWSRRDGRFVAEIPPQVGDGPWVVRVEVEDQYGHPLGRDFVEVAPRTDFDNAPPVETAPPQRAQR